MMARSLRAGHALSSAFKLVAAEMPEPVSIEFGRAFEAQELGMPFEKAVGDMTRRAPDNQDLKIFALSVIVQKETGGNLVEIIEKIAETVRVRYKFQGKLRALTAEGRMSSYVVGALPWVSLLLSMVSNPAYAMVLFKTQVGHYVLGYAVIELGAGVLDHAQDDEGDHLMDLFGGVSLELLLARRGRACCSSWCWRSARGSCSAAQRDEVIERLERATSGGIDLEPHDEKDTGGLDRADRRASCGRSRSW